MGRLRYGGVGEEIVIDDVALAHLKVVITTKLRRDESFTVSWDHPDDQPGGRSTIWLHPSIPLWFVFDDVEPAELNPAWLDDLVRSSHSTGGIRLDPKHLEGGVQADADGAA